MLDFVIEYAANLYDPIVSYWFILRFIKSNFRDNKLCILFCFLSFTVSNIFTHMSDLSVLLQSLIQTIILLIFALTIKNGKLLPKILAPVIFEIVLIVTNTLVLFCLSSFSGISILEISTRAFVVRYIHIFMCKLVMTIILAIILRIFSIADKFTAIDFLVYLLLPIISVINLNIFMQLGYEYDISKYTVTIIAVVVAIAVVNILILLLFKKAVQNTQAKYELEMINSRKDLEEQRYKELNDVYHQLQLTRHDLKDHLLYIENLISEKRYDEANRYINDRKNEINASKKIRLTGDRLLDFIIDSKLSPYDDIRYSVRGKLEQLENIEEIDIAVLFGNILDNAVRGVADASDKYIELSFSVTGNYQNIICRNTIGSSVLANNASLSTTKTDKTRHGYGTKSIRRIVEKYSGLLEFSEENGRFCVQIALPIDNN